MADYPDTERALIELVVAGGHVDGQHAGTETPAQTFWPYVRVGRFGGPRDDLTDQASVDVEAFHGTRDGALQLLEAVLATLGNGGRPSGQVVIDRFRVRSGPSRLPWPNTSVRRFGATCEVDARRQ